MARKPSASGRLLFAAIFALLFTPALAQHETARCENLQRADFSGLEDAPAEINAAEAINAAAPLPAYCRVQGYIAPNTGFELRLPLDHWNGKFFYAGCTGSCGFAADSSWTAECDYPLTRGYACIISDMGHRSGSSDGLWAYRNLEARVDFGFRATHRTAVLGKAVTEAFYERAPEYSYFMGCSTGGRQGLVAAQRFPADFDGIIAGAPVVREYGTAMDFLWNLAAMADDEGRPLFDQQDLALLHRAALAAGDDADGLKDGVIGNPAAVEVPLDDLLCKAGSKKDCLTAAQVAAARKIYAGPTNSAGMKLYPGAGAQPGSELGWHIFSPGRDGGPAPSQQSGVDTTRFMLSDWGPDWTFRDFDFDRDHYRMGEAEALYSASNPDLRDFKAAGGKLLIYHGWADPIVMPNNSVDYYEMVERAMGGRQATQDFARLFMVPGMKHCFGGAGAFAIDYISALEAWVERGEAPDQLRAAHLDGDHDSPSMIRMFPRKPAEERFTRPIFPYPLEAHYDGKGDPADAASFRAVEPTRP